MPLTQRTVSRRQSDVHYCDYTSHAAVVPGVQVRTDSLRRVGDLRTRSRSESEIFRRDNSLAWTATRRNAPAVTTRLSEFPCGEDRHPVGHADDRAKGLDFPIRRCSSGVTTAGLGVAFPRFFRASERTFSARHSSRRSGRSAAIGADAWKSCKRSRPEHPADSSRLATRLSKFRPEREMNNREVHYRRWARREESIIRAPSRKTEARADSLLSRLNPPAIAQSEVRISRPRAPIVRVCEASIGFHLLLQATEAAVVGETIRVHWPSSRPPERGRSSFSLISIRLEFVVSIAE